MSFNERFGVSMSDFGQLVKTLRRWDERIVTRLVLIDMAGDFIAGTILGRILYWHEDDKEENTRLRVEIDGHLWMARGYDDWWKECRLTLKQAERAYSILKDKQLIITKIAKFNGNPTVHCRIDPDVFIKAWNEAIENPPTENTFRPKDSGGRNVSSLKGETKTTKRQKRSSLNGVIDSPVKAGSISTRDTTRATALYNGVAPATVGAATAPVVDFDTITQSLIALGIKGPQARDLAARLMVLPQAGSLLVEAKGKRNPAGWIISVIEVQSSSDAVAVLDTLPTDDKAAKHIYQSQFSPEERERVDQTARPGEPGFVLAVQDVLRERE